MNAVEIADAVADLAAQPFEAAEFPFQFLAAFDKKETQLKRLRKGDTNRSDVPGGVLLQSNIHLAVCAVGETHAAFDLLKASPQTAKAKAKFILATDGQTLEAEELSTGDAIASEFPKLAEHIGFFLPLAGISTVREIKDNPIDVRATGRLNKLYVELLRQNPEWGTDARRHDMNHFMARLIFCFFAEDTNIFPGGQGLFTSTIEQFTESDGSNTHQVLESIFSIMDTHPDKRDYQRLPSWVVRFPYVNGGLFCDSAETPRFTRIARSYLLQAGGLDWQHINPDIFGSMIQAVADEDERGALGMHYTSVPNILKVLNPLFLDELRAQVASAGTNTRALRKLKERLRRIRVFDPACGSGNFLVIAYKQMRDIEASIDRSLQEKPKRSVIPLDNFRGIEIRDFAVEVARLALVIAEYQSNVLYLGQEQAHLIFLPLAKKNWITHGNALRLDWLKLWPAEGIGVKLVQDDLFQTPLEQPVMDFENEGGETYICGNPPYKGSSKRSSEQEEDLIGLKNGSIEKWGILDYVCGWFFKAFHYSQAINATFAFVATNSVVQGQHVALFWKPLFEKGLAFRFGIRSFKWSNLAANDAGVTVVCVGASIGRPSSATIYDEDVRIQARNINGYLLSGDNVWVEATSSTPLDRAAMLKGNYYGLSEHLLFSPLEALHFTSAGLLPSRIKNFYGSAELINGRPRNCLWFENLPTSAELVIRDVSARIEAGRIKRSTSKDARSNGMLERPHQFREMRSARSHLIAIPVVSSERRNYLPVDLLPNSSVVSNKCFALYDAALWNMALIASRLHWVWIGTVCVRMRTDFSYSNTLGWNTFPMPELTEQDKSDLTRCAEDILLAREAHFPATIADLYKPETDEWKMPDNLRAAHDRNDETLERIYIGRRFKNDTERLETLFAMYAKMTAETKPVVKRRAGGSK